MVAGRHIKDFRGLYRCCDRRKLAGDIREVHSTPYRDRSSAWSLPRRHLV